MAIRIKQKIVGYSVVRDDVGELGTEAAPTAANAETIETMHELLQRPEALEGSTYKIKTPLSEHALYVTINDLILNPGTEHEVRRPFEIFINSKNMDHFQWIVALTRIVSAVFRKGGDCTFLAEELHSVFDPRGGYFKKGGRFMPSLVAEIGDVIETHLRRIGMIEGDGLDPAQRAFIAEKRAELERRKPGSEGAGDDGSSGTLPANASLCEKCQTRAAVMLDGCLTCLSCGHSKCG